MKDLQQQMADLKAYLEEFPDALDLIFLTDDITFLKHRWSEELRQHFHPIARTRGGVVIAFWAPDQAHSWERHPLPLVWLDIEGIPQSVFADSWESFLSLLYFDTGLIYEILIDKYFYEEDPEAYQNPDERFSQEAMQQRLNNEEPEMELIDFRNWLVEDQAIEFTKDPLVIIGLAQERWPNLSTWLSQKENP